MITEPVYSFIIDGILLSHAVRTVASILSASFWLTQSEVDDAFFVSIDLTNSLLNAEHSTTARRYYARKRLLCVISALG